MTNKTKLLVITSLALALAAASWARPVVYMTRPVSSYGTATNTTADDYFLLNQRETNSTSTNFYLRQIRGPVPKLNATLGELFAGQVSPFSGRIQNSAAPGSELIISDGMVYFPGAPAMFALTSVVWTPTDGYPQAGGGANVSTVTTNVNINFLLPLLGGYERYVSFDINQAPGTVFCTAGFHNHAAGGEFDIYGSFELADYQDPTGTYYATGSDSSGTFTMTVTFGAGRIKSGWTEDRLFCPTDDGGFTYYLHLDSDGNQTWNTTP